MAVNLLPIIININVVRKKDARVRYVIYENGARADLTGDTFTFVAKTQPGGTIKVNVSGTLEAQSGDTLGELTVLLPKASLLDDGSPNDSLTSVVEWPYQLIRVHGGEETVPIAGTLTLEPTI